jgi:hypothetical protein
MFSDARIRASLDTMVRGIEAPPVILHQIQRKILQQPAIPRYMPHYLRLAISAAVIIAMLVITLPSISPALVQTIEARYRAALQALGGIAPPPAPKSLFSTLSSQSRNATLASAQSRVRFAIVPPAGLPNDVVSVKIQTTPTGVYSKITHSWSVGPPSVSFSYHRADGRSFDLMAEQFNPRDGLQPKYMFEADGPASNGRPVLVKHEHFAWRNGNQVMMATQSDGISAREIEAIQEAMRGVALPRRELHAPDTGTTMKLYVKP